MTLMDIMRVDGKGGAKLEDSRFGGSFTLSPCEEESYQEMVTKWQRDVNCLADPDRSVRKRALVKFQSYLEDGKNHEAIKKVSQKFFVSVLMKPLFQCISDPVEKCRELAVECTRLMVHELESSAMCELECFQNLIQICNTRLGVLPFVEPAEEIRCVLMKVVLDVIKALDGAMLGNSELVKKSFSVSMDKFANVIAKALLDSFPDSKKICCTCIQVSCSKFPQEMKFHLGSIVKSLLTNLGHQHSKVRHSTLQALEVLVPCGSEQLFEVMKEVLLPILPSVVVDRTPSVRKCFYTMLQTWLSTIDNIQPIEDKLMPLLLSGIADESEEIQRATIEAIDMMGDRFLALSDSSMDDTSLNEESNQCMFKFSDAPSFQRPPRPFLVRPHYGSRLKMVTLLPKLLPSILEDTSDWTVPTRTRSTAVLRALMVYAENGINPHIDRVLTALAKICRDEEPSVVQAVSECLHVLGHYGDAGVIFSFLLPRLAGKIEGQDTAVHRTNTLALLSMVVAGMEVAILVGFFGNIVGCLSDTGMRESESPELQEELVLTVSNILKVVGSQLEQNDELGYQIFWIISQLLASTPQQSNAHEQATICLQLLSQSLSCTVEEVFLRYLFRLVQDMDAPSNPEGQCWTKDAPRRLLFDFLCRRAGKARGTHMEILVPIIMTHLMRQREPAVRLAFLALLETMLGDQQICESFKPFASSILLMGVMPNMIWEAGKVSATIRKVAMACTYTLLRHDLADQQCLFKVTPQLLPVLKSSLDGDDAKTRQLVCLSLQYLFVGLPGALGEEPVHEMYHEILKRLDDSNDVVRKACCATFRTFLHASPAQSFKGTIIDYSLDSFFVHLDDTESEIQEEVFQTIKECMIIDRDRVRMKAIEHRGRHRSPDYCDKLIALCST